MNGPPPDDAALPAEPEEAGDVRPIARMNHFLPRDYTRAWADDAGRIWTYRVLVPAACFPPWEARSPDNSGFHRDLYTDTASGTESDAIERWLHEALEQPAQDPIARLRADKDLSDRDWDKVQRYLIALAQRTPAALRDHLAMMERHLPSVLSSIKLPSPAQLEAWKHKGREGPQPPRIVPFRTRFESTPDGGQALRIAALTGRHSWLRLMRHTLESTVPTIPRHSWSVFRPRPGWMWFTSDAPVILLNGYSSGRYDFTGGWANPGTEILCPMSPHHLLYTKVGESRVQSRVQDDARTRFMQRLVAEHAHRVLIARRSHAIVEAVRPRTVDQAAFAAEEDTWKRFHAQQKSAEADFGLEEPPQDL